MLVHELSTESWLGEAETDEERKKRLRKLRNLRLAAIMRIFGLIMTPLQEPAVPPPLAPVVAPDPRRRSRGGQGGSREAELAALPEAAVMDRLGRLAAATPNEAEAEAFVGALPTLAATLVPNAAPALVGASSQMVSGMSSAAKVLRESAATRDLVRWLPTVARRTALRVGHQAARGNPLTPDTCSRILADTAVRVLSEAALEVEIRDELVGEWESAEAPFEPGLEQFDGSEHKWIGDKGSGGVKTALVYGAANTPLTFGDVVALAGDMYASYYDLAKKSRTRGGRAELAWALWYALKVPKAPEPRAYVAAKGEDAVETKKREDAVKKDVEDRYLALAAENISHFSAGGTGAATYMKWHAAAMADALAAGQNGDDHQWRIAIGKEAFGDHFLTDIFSAGHVRTPRAEIKEWYKQHGLGSSAPFVDYMAAFMLSRLRGRNPWLNIPIVSGFALGVLRTRVRDLGGEALQSFSLGDIVSLALHDLDNEGLDVVSKVDPTGRRPANGHPWRAIGDGHLPEPQGAATRQMVTAAVVVSFRDLARVRDAGRGIGKRNLTAPAGAQAIKQALKGTLFPALDYVPKEDKSSKSNPTLTSTSGRADLEWRWGQLGDKAYDAVNKAIKQRITKELAAKIKTVDDTATASLGIKIHGTKPALQAFVDHLAKEGIGALQRAVGKPARERRPSRPGKQVVVR